MISKRQVVPASKAANHGVDIVNMIERIEDDLFRAGLLDLSARFREAIASLSRAVTAADAAARETFLAARRGEI